MIFSELNFQSEPLVDSSIIDFGTKPTLWLFSIASVLLSQLSRKLKHLFKVFIIYNLLKVYYYTKVIYFVLFTIMHYQYPIIYIQ